MLMGAYKYILQSFAKTTAERGDILRKRLQEWRSQPPVIRIEKPTNPARAREIGYKAKKEIVVIRVRVHKGKRTRRKPNMGRKPGKNVKRVSMAKPLSWMATQKALRKHTNLALVGSYKAATDGDSEYFEVILR